MTRQQLEAKIRLLENLANIANSIEEDILDDLEEVRDNSDDLDGFEYILKHFRTGNLTRQTLLEELDPYISKLENGKQVDTPTIMVDLLDSDSVADIQVTVPLKDGGELEMSATDIDGSGTRQVFINYKDEEKNLIDLCGVEIKKGELAKANGLQEDNKDIDIYTYGDPYSEDYTDKTTIANEDIEKALGKDNLEL